jgi:battenin
LSQASADNSHASGPTIPKSAVLLFDVIPSFFVKLTAPYYVHMIPYQYRIWIFVALSTCGMLLIALTPSSVTSGVSRGNKGITPDWTEILVKMSGVVFASLSSGGGELSFLGLTHHYGSYSLAAWGSGTGAAGLIGAGAYVLATTIFGLSVRTSLLAFSILPLIKLLSFFLVLPTHAKLSRGYDHISYGDEEHEEDAEGPLLPQNGSECLAREAMVSPRHTDSLYRPPSSSLKTKLRRARGLIAP